MTTSKLSLVAGNIDDPQRPALSLNESYELLALAEESAGIGAWDRDIATSMMRGTPTFFRMMGLEPTAEPVHMDSVRAVRHPEDAARVVEGFEQALARGLDIYESEYRIVLPSDGQLRWILGRGRAIRDAAGRPIRYCGVDIDITERKQAEQVLRETQERFSKAFNAAAYPMSITTLDEGRYVDINAAGLAAAGLSREQVIGQTVRDLGFYNDTDHYSAVRERLARDGQFTDLETTLRGRTGTRTYLMSGSLVQLGGETCLLTSAVDITERKQAEAHVRLLMNEVNHRANNLLAVVQAIARHTLGTTDPAEYSERLSQRIAGLAASNNLLVSGKWQGVDLGKLIDSQLSHFSDLGRRVGLDGSPVRLKPAAAQAIGMALHELATNALKYGAFANRTGNVLIAWNVAGDGDERVFGLTWTERGGPTVAAPTRRGFGHTVMQEMIEGALGGKARIEFAGSGLVWSFIGPAGQVLDVDR